MYFARIHTLAINTLITEAFNVNKTLLHDGVYSWTTFIYNIFKEFNLNTEDLIHAEKFYSKIKNVIKKELKIKINDTYIKRNFDKIKGLTESSKLYFYSKI